MTLRTIAAACPALFLATLFLTACASTQSEQAAVPASIPASTPAPEYIAPPPSDSAPGAVGDPAPGGSPALWRASDADTTIWLFGTIHILPRNFQWRTPAIDSAMAASDMLVLETLAGAGQCPDRGDVTLLLMQLGMFSAQPPINERVATDLLPQLASMIARGPFPEFFLNGLETWAAALMLVGVALNDLGLDSENGVEEQLELVFQREGKPVTGLETPSRQLSFFDTLPEEAQRYFLSSVIATPEDIREEFDAMLNAWRSGDEAAIASIFDNELAQSKALREALLTRRNANWAAWVARRLDRPGTVFMAVGAGHLAGDDSVQDFLHAAGIQTIRVQ